MVFGHAELFGGIEHESDIPILRCRKPCIFHLSIHSIHTLAKFLHIIILMQKCRNFRITGEMDLAHIVQSDFGYCLFAFFVSFDIVCQFLILIFRQYFLQSTHSKVELVLVLRKSICFLNLKSLSDI